MWSLVSPDQTESFCWSGRDNMSVCHTAGQPQSRVGGGQAVGKAYEDVLTSMYLSIKISTIVAVMRIKKQPEVI